MSPEAIIAVLGGFITTLFGVIGYLWKLHVKDDEQRDKDLADAKTALGTSTANVTALVPAVATLTESVRTVDERAEQRYANIQKQSSDQHAEIIKALRRRRPGP